MASGRGDICRRSDCKDGAPRRSRARLRRGYRAKLPSCLGSELGPSLHVPFAAILSRKYHTFALGVVHFRSPSVKGIGSSVQGTRTCRKQCRPAGSTVRWTKATMYLALPMPRSRLSSMAAMRAPIAVRPTRALPRSAIASASACAMCSGSGHSPTTTSPAAPPSWQSRPARVGSGRRTSR